MGAGLWQNLNINLLFQLQNDAGLDLLCDFLWNVAKIHSHLSIMDIGGRYLGTLEVIFLFSKEALKQFCCVGVTGAVTGPFRPGVWRTGPWRVGFSNSRLFSAQRGQKTLLDCGPRGRFRETEPILIVTSTNASDNLFIASTVVPLYDLTLQLSLGGFLPVRGNNRCIYFYRLGPDICKSLLMLIHSAYSFLKVQRLLYSTPSNLAGSKLGENNLPHQFPRRCRCGWTVTH